jgi:hypothetical protein
MKKLLLISSCCLFLGACGAFHTKQPINDTYYKKTQSAAWPGEENATAQSDLNNAEYGASQKADPKLNWQDADESAPKMAIPAMPEKKLQCVKTGRDTYTCRMGQYQCGTGCRSDGSNCRNGYCLQSDCDDVLGQKWDLVYIRNQNLYACQHPTTKVFCRPDGSWKTTCWGSDGLVCGRECNANGTQCAAGSDTCWAKYRDV